MEFIEYELEIKLEFEEAIENLERNLSRVNLGGANPQLISVLKVNYYDTLTPIGDIASITHPEPQQLLIKPFDKSITKEIHSVIVKQNYSISIQDEGDKLRIIFPILTTEKRKESVKQLSTIKEQAKIKIRNARQVILKKIKADEELSEDMLKLYQNNIQKLVDQIMEKIEQIIKEKETQLLKI